MVQLIMNVLKIIPYAQIVIFTVSTAVAFRGEFCENGEINVLECPEDSLVTGIQATSKLSSIDATPVCSKIADEIVPSDRLTDYGYMGTMCLNEYYTIKGIRMCFEDGVMTELEGDCRRLKYITRSEDLNLIYGGSERRHVPSDDVPMYHVSAGPNGTVLECNEGSVLNWIMFLPEGAGDLRTLATCIPVYNGTERISVFEKKPPSALHNCSVGDETEYTFRVTCQEGRDGGLEQRFRVEVYWPDRALLYNVTFNSTDFFVFALWPATEYYLTMYAFNAAGRSPPLTIKASTKAERRGFCKEGLAVKIACPEGYLVTGVQTTSKIFSQDATPICSEIANKTVTSSRKRKLRYYFEPSPLVQTDCGGSEPVVLKFSLCYVNGEITKTKTQCVPFQDNVTVTAYYSIEGQLDSPVLKCPEGSFLQGLRMESGGNGWQDDDGNENDDDDDDGSVRIRGKCTVIEE